MHILKSQLSGFTCKTESYLTRPNCIQVNPKCDLTFYDSLERQIVVIMHTFKMYGHSSEHLGESHGSSPVTTTPLLNLFSYTTGFYFHACILVREDRYAIFIDY